MKQDLHVADCNCLQPCINTSLNSDLEKLSDWRSSGTNKLLPFLVCESESGAAKPSFYCEQLDETKCITKQIFHKQLKRWIHNEDNCISAQM